MTWQLQYGADDIDDGIDNDGDGLIDEMELVRTMTGVDGSSTVKTANVPEGSFSLSKLGNLITVQLTLSVYIPDSDQTISFAANSVSVALQ